MRWDYLSWLLSMPTYLAASIVLGDLFVFMKRQWVEWCELIRCLRKV